MSLRASAPFRDEAHPQQLRVFVLEAVDVGTWRFISDHAETITFVQVTGQGEPDGEDRSATLDVNGIPILSLVLASGESVAGGPASFTIDAGVVVRLVLTGASADHRASAEIRAVGAVPTLYRLLATSPLTT